MHTQFYYYTSSINYNLTIATNIPKHETNQYIQKTKLYNEPAAHSNSTNKQIIFTPDVSNKPW